MLRRNVALNFILVTVQEMDPFPNLTLFPHGDCVVPQRSLYGKVEPVIQIQEHHRTVENGIVLTSSDHRYQHHTLGSCDLFCHLALRRTETESGAARAR